MVTIRFHAQVDHEKCTGCRTCFSVCPTMAITMLEDPIKAVVDETKCVACQNCTGMCNDHAIAKVPRSEPLVLGVDYKSVDQDRIMEICRKANINPAQWWCMCTGTRSREGAAAIIKGAKTPEEMARMTGTAAGCAAYCRVMSLRLLKAAGIEVEPEGYRWYDTTHTIWELKPEFVAKYPGYFLEEDKDTFRKY